MDSFPLPHMEEMFANLCGATEFYTLELQSAYHQVTFSEDSQAMMMSEILKGQSGAHCYLDGIMVAAAMLKEHDGNLQAVLQWINEAGLKLNMTKCHFIRAAPLFLAYTLYEKG